MAETAEIAIEKVKDNEGPLDLPELAHFRKGVWTAEERETGICDLHSYADEATDAERSERASRK